jgi:hypothetical protein
MNSALFTSTSRFIKSYENACVLKAITWCPIYKNMNDIEIRHAVVKFRRLFIAALKETYSHRRNANILIKVWLFQLKRSWKYSGTFVTVLGEEALVYTIVLEAGASVIILPQVPWRFSMAKLRLTMVPWRLTMRPWRLTTELWRLTMPPWWLTTEPCKFTIAQWRLTMAPCAHLDAMEFYPGAV